MSKSSKKLREASAEIIADFIKLAKVGKITWRLINAPATPPGSNDCTMEPASVLRGNTAKYTVLICRSRILRPGEDSIDYRGLITTELSKPPAIFNIGDLAACQKIYDLGSKVCACRFN